MAKFTKSKCYKGIKEIREELQETFKKFKETEDKILLSANLKIAIEKTLKLIEEINS